MKRICLYILFCGVLLCGCSNLEIDGRKANSIERSYQGIAYDIEEQDLCYKIYPKAYLTAAWGGRGTEVSYIRSECLFQLAVKTKNPYYCRDVASVSTWDLDGSYYSKENCEAVAAEGGQSFGASISYELIMPQLGYTQEDWPDAAKKNYETFEDKKFANRSAWQDTYFAVRYSHDFRDRVKSLPAFTE